MSLIVVVCVTEQHVCSLTLPLLQLLNAIQLFGANLDDYLHLLLPPIVKLFDAPDVPLQARKSVLHAVTSEPHILPPVNHKLTRDGELSPTCVFCIKK